MLYLTENSDFAETYYDEVKVFIMSKLPNQPDLISQFIVDNIDDLLKGSPHRLIQLNEIFYNSINAIFSSVEHDNFIRKKIKINAHTTNAQLKAVKIRYKRLHNYIKSLVDYDDWANQDVSKGAYKLALNLNKSTCIYCNRIYTITLIKNKTEKGMRPQFDHWFSKSNYPLLALSYYNLIPSCPYCNSSIKGNTIFDLDNYLHPYIDKAEYLKQKISYLIVEGLNFRTSIILKTDSQKAINTFDALFLKQTYEAHQSEINDLIKLRQEYSKDYIKDLIKLFPNTNLTEGEIYRLVFGTESDPDNYHKRPFSKLKKDVLEEFDINQPH